MVITWRAQRVNVYTWKEREKRGERRRAFFRIRAAAAATHAAEGGGKSQREPPIAQGKKGAVAIRQRIEQKLLLALYTSEKINKKQMGEYIEEEEWGEMYKEKKKKKKNRRLLPLLARNEQRARAPIAALTFNSTASQPSRGRKI